MAQQNVLYSFPFVAFAQCLAIEFIHARLKSIRDFDSHITYTLSSLQKGVFTKQRNFLRSTCVNDLHKHPSSIPHSFDKFFGVTPIDPTQILFIIAHLMRNICVHIAQLKFQFRKHEYSMKILVDSRYQFINYEFGLMCVCFKQKDENIGLAVLKQLMNLLMVLYRIAGLLFVTKIYQNCERVVKATDYLHGVCYYAITQI